MRGKFTTETQRHSSDTASSLDFNKLCLRVSVVKNLFAFTLDLKIVD